MRRARGRHVEDVSRNADREDPAETLVEDQLNEHTRIEVLVTCRQGLQLQTAEDGQLALIILTQGQHGTDVSATRAA